MCTRCCIHPHNSEVQLDREPQGENAVLYSFTGMRTFKGWKSEGGEIDNDLTNDNGNIVKTKDMNFDPTGGNNYRADIDYCLDFRTNSPCSQCGEKQVNAKWPGVRMLPDNENPGWFYFDLPALANPNATLIMFADTHDSGTGGNISNEKRYPPHMEPGVPLYDYEDKDGWFLYDYKIGAQNEFVDDKPEIEVTTYRINILQNSYQRIHVWIVDGATITNWDDASTGVIQTDEKGRYFQFSIKGSPLSGAIRYKYIDSGNSYDGEINVNNWQPATGKTYDYEYTIN